MECSKVQVAAAVLTAIVHYQEPSLAQVNALRNLAESDDERRMPLDDLARTVITREIERSRSGGPAAVSNHTEAA